MVAHTPEPVARGHRGPPAPAADAPALAPQDLVPHLRGLARALREGGAAERAARVRAPRS
ncbi:MULTISPECIES: hypothetical protein [unclassified Nocardiopsis]|uniref:hypothetical protein n=1 Tax=unclassified Nocardiopsis TaxID=2649073 RepID=UPI00135B4D9A|nr:MULTISPECIES: hypothetical protein [unclassified Nocardiopsis]